MRYLVEQTLYRAISENIPLTISLLPYDWCVFTTFFRQILWVPLNLLENDFLSIDFRYLFPTENIEPLIRCYWQPLFRK